MMNSTMTNHDKDTLSRNRIVSEMNKNFFVEAGAGSGKTTMLVNRMVAMVESGIPIDKICAITFTKAAAGEFYERFQKILIERSNPEYKWEDTGRAGQLPAPTEKSRAFCDEALKNIDLCFMGTIDSFCGMLLSEHPSEAGIPSDSQIITDEDAQDLYKQEYVKICGGEYGKELADKARSFGRFYWNSKDVFVKSASLLMNKRNVHFNYNPPTAFDIDKLYADEKNNLLHIIKLLMEHRELEYDKNATSRQAWDSLEDIYKNLRKRWSTAFDNVIDSLKTLGGIRLIPEAFNHYENELAGLFDYGGVRKKWLECDICGEHGIRSKLVGIRYGITMDFLEECVPILEKSMHDKGRLTFFDYLYYLRNMLRKDAEKDGKLIRYIYDRHSYFLIDEFQDTNPMQAEVFFYLTAKKPVPEWTECEPQPGSLFIVGDPKQSIYRFRSADVQSFLRVKGLFEKSGGDILVLSRNFRSKRSLIDFFNQRFEEMLPEETIDQSKFERIPEPEFTPDEFQGIYTYVAYTGKLMAVHPNEVDSLQISRIIERIVDNDEYLIRGGKDKELRKLRYSDIMVITYGKNTLGPIMEALDAKGIPSKVEGQVPFGENDALKEIWKLYSAIAVPNDSRNIYGALTGKIFGFGMNDVLYFNSVGGKLSFGEQKIDESACESHVIKEIQSAIKKLKEFHHEARTLSPAALFSEVMDKYRVYEYASAEKMEVVYYALELLRNAEKSGAVVSGEDGATFIEQLIDGASGEERCLSLNDEKDAVHMANLHKVKGLEAPVVILAAATQFRNGFDCRIVQGDKNAEGYLFSVTKDLNTKYFKTDEFPDEKEEETTAYAAENTRLVYVAATRARNVLILCDSIRKTRSGETHASCWEGLRQGNTLSDFFETTAENDCLEESEEVSVDVASLYDAAEDKCVLNDRSNEQESYHLENPSRLALASKFDEEQTTSVLPGDETAVEPSKTVRYHAFPALVGTMTHKLMEMLVSTKNKLDVEEAVGEIIREYRTAETESYEKQLAKELIGVANTMRAGGYPQTNGLPQDMLKTLLSADEVYCEVPFSYTEDTENGKVLWNGIMDVVYLSEGKWHIVDYKTNADGSDLDKKYRAQMSAYVKAFKAITGEEADAATYHIGV